MQISNIHGEFSVHKLNAFLTRHSYKLQYIIMVMNVQKQLKKKKRETNYRILNVVCDQVLWIFI